MEDMSEQPMPSIRPMAVIRSQNGEKMFTAANASLPTPCPIKTPSITVIKEMQSMPKSVGISILPNSFGMLSEPKSIASLCIQSSFSKDAKLRKIIPTFVSLTYLLFQILAKETPYLVRHCHRLLRTRHPVTETGHHRRCSQALAGTVSPKPSSSDIAYSSA